MYDNPDFTMRETSANSRFHQMVPYKSFSSQYDSAGPSTTEVDLEFHCPDVVYYASFFTAHINASDYCAVSWLLNDIRLNAMRSKVGVLARFDQVKLTKFVDGDVLTCRYTNPSPNVYSFTNVVNMWRVLL